MRQPGCHDMGQGKANPTAMILSAAMMLDWLADRGVDWRAPSRADLRAYLAHLGARGARSRALGNGGPEICPHL